MLRFVTCLVFLFAFITLVFANVTVINTPLGNIQQGANITITWDTNSTATSPGNLRVINKSTQNNIIISDNVDINAKKFDWQVNVDPGTYNLAINDGTGDQFSGAFNVVESTAKSPAKTISSTPSTPPKTPKSKSPKSPKTKFQDIVYGSPSITSPASSTMSPKQNVASSISTQNLWLSLMGVSLFMIHFA